MENDRPIRGGAILNFRRSQIHIDPDLNIRDLSTIDNVAHIEELAALIEENGFTSIIRVFSRDGKYLVDEGHCRMAAVDLLISRGKWDDETMLIPAFPAGKGKSELEMICGQFTSNGTSKALNAREAAANVLRLMNLMGQDEEKVARKIGRSRSYVSQLLSFNEAATPEVHAAIERGEISQSQAATVLRKEGGKKGAETIQKAVQAAKSSGKKKATAKTVKAVAPSPAPALAPRKLFVETPNALATVIDVKRAAIVLARDFLLMEVMQDDYIFPDMKSRARRIIAELNLALGETPVTRELETAHA